MPLPFSKCGNHQKEENEQQLEGTIVKGEFVFLLKTEFLSGPAGVKEGGAS